MKYIDIPPVWLLLFLGIAWWQAVYFPILSLESGLTDLISGVLIGGGLVLMMLAFVEFRKHKTTAVPHETPTQLIQSGIFKRSRNPIYIADMLLLAGFILRWDAIISLALIPLFLWVIEKRFVIPEEDRLRRKFRVQYAAYCRKVRRWI
ncbi:methyltransferase family protein [Cochlodiniinecator piscidefendens]|uniref:methyltransferase family protein n=1 Tax=Cochlodiniinecator piscidefendens TaxID=2715756 RepID=UPI0014072F9B|nr:isoprenylcysteine carboxylmethyltransferase family protein [Cochlodiniinecator piscidefendens]